MDDTSGSQKNTERKAQLSWSQPLHSPAQKTAAPQKETVKSVPAPARAVPAGKSSTKRNILIAGIVVAVALVVWAAVAYSKRGDETKLATNPAGTGAQTATSNTTQTGNAASLSDGSLTIPAVQDAGLQVAVTNIVVTSPMWVVVYENYNGQPGNVLGAGLFTADRRSGSVDLLRGTLPGQTYFVGEARDDGDHMFSIENDPAVRDSSGNPTWIQFQTR